jgi:hypothetical protein
MERADVQSCPRATPGVPRSVHAAIGSLPSCDCGCGILNPGGGSRLGGGGHLRRLQSGAHPRPRRSRPGADLASHSAAAPRPSDVGLAGCVLGCVALCVPPCASAVGAGGGGALSRPLSNLASSHVSCRIT